MIIETLISTVNDAGRLNVAPMGPLAHEGDFAEFTLRPFQSSTTFKNLKQTKEGVVNITDNVELFVQTALDLEGTNPETIPAKTVKGRALADCCHWFEFRAINFLDNEQRAEVFCRTAHQETVRPFIGFNRASFAVIEATILATRVSFLPFEPIAQQLESLKTIVEKTGGERECRSFELVENFVHNYQPGSTATAGR